VGGSRESAAGEEAAAVLIVIEFNSWCSGECGAADTLGHAPTIDQPGEKIILFQRGISERRLSALTQQRSILSRSARAAITLR
jgi:hypothetical protein